MVDRWLVLLSCNLHIASLSPGCVEKGFWRKTIANFFVSLLAEESRKNTQQITGISPTKNDDDG